MRTLLLAVLAVSLAAAANAAETLESVRAHAALALPAQSGLVLKFKRALLAKTADVKQETPKAPKATRLLRASGYLSLNGSGVWNGSGFASVPVSGWVNLTDETGAPISGSVYMTATAMVNVSGSFANGWVTPQAYVSLYDGGKLLGTMLVQGSLYVSGFVNGNWISLNGQGQVGGQMYVDQ